MLQCTEKLVFPTLQRPHPTALFNGSASHKNAFVVACVIIIPGIGE
jgi:hypothetical protein